MATEQCTADVVAKREAFLAEIHACDPERLIFIDESGSHISMTRTRAWAPKGVRAFGRVPRNRGRVTTMIAALSIDGIEALMTVEGGTSAPVFLKFLDEHLVPKLRPGDVVVMDNLNHSQGRRRLVQALRSSSASSQMKNAVSHLAALVGAGLARLRTCLAVVHLVLRALGPAGIADVGAQLADRLRVLTAARHQLRGVEADGRAVLIQADAGRQLGDVRLAEARDGAHLASLST